MGGPVRPPTRQTGFRIGGAPIPEIDVVRGVQGTLGSVRSGLDRTFENIDPVRAGGKIMEGVQGVGDSFSSLGSSPEVVAAMDKEKQAVELGFANEADRIAKVSKIIDAFGKGRKAPAALLGATKKLNPGIMV